MKLIDADEAFRILSEYYHHRTQTQADALREALDRVPEAFAIEYIVRETSYQGATKQEVIRKLVRCKDCRYYKEDERWCRRLGLVGAFAKDGFCSRGERRTE